MLGGSLLIAPVFSEDGTVDYYVPAGRWTNLLTGQVQEGPGWCRETHGFLSLPLMVRPGTVLPLGAVDERPDYNYADGVTFRILELTDDRELTCAVSTPQRGETTLLTMRRRGKRVTASVSGDTSVRWQVQFAGAQTVTAQNGASAKPDPLGLILSPAEGSQQLELEL
jgi:alpha-D-xyloside xylohydrolase